MFLGPIYTAPSEEAVSSKTIIEEPTTNPVLVKVMPSSSNGPKVLESLPICKAAIYVVGVLELIPENAINPSLLSVKLNNPLFDIVPIDAPKLGFELSLKSENIIIVPALIVSRPEFQVIVPSLPTSELGDPIPVV